MDRLDLANELLTQTLESRQPEVDSAYDAGYDSRRHGPSRLAI